MSKSFPHPNLFHALGNYPDSNSLPFLFFAPDFTLSFNPNQHLSYQDVVDSGYSAAYPSRNAAPVLLGASNNAQGSKLSVSEAARGMRLINKPIHSLRAAAFGMVLGLGGLIWFSGGRDMLIAKVSTVMTTKLNVFNEKPG